MEDSRDRTRRECALITLKVGFGCALVPTPLLSFSLSSLSLTHPPSAEPPRPHSPRHGRDGFVATHLEHTGGPVFYVRIEIADERTESIRVILGRLVTRLLWGGAVGS
jgi:hypothetical protein